MSLLELIEVMAQAFEATPTIRHEPAASGDIPHSATTTRLTQALAWQSSTALVDGLGALAQSLRTG